MTPNSNSQVPQKSPPSPWLIATLGPKSVGLEHDLGKLGVDWFRLNASHMTRDTLRERITAARQAAPNVPVIVDLQGAKMRLGDFEKCDIAAGECVRFTLDGEDSIPLPHPEVYSVLSRGDRISIDDGRISGVVEQVSAGSLEIRFLSGGQLKPRKGFNRENHPLVLTDLCARDAELGRVAYECGCRSFAVSFVQDGGECEWIRRAFEGAQVTSKIERHDALHNIEAIAEKSDAVWVCRGDLGVQIGLSRLGHAVAGIDPRRFETPVIMAGQVLEHTTTHREATRSEVCHIYDLVRSGYAGIVLSDETAIGCDPLNAARLARDFLDFACD